jgi:hypothetical protein
MSRTITGGLDQSLESGPECRRHGAPRAPGASAATDWRRTPRTAPGRDRSSARDVKALLPDVVIDELLAGAPTKEEIAGPGGCCRS